MPVLKQKSCAIFNTDKKKLEKLSLISTEIWEGSGAKFVAILIQRLGRGTPLTWPGLKQTDIGGKVDWHDS
jgi:hypothetical protein